MDTSGFYKLNDETLMHGPNGVSAPDFELHREHYDSYTYPVDGWYWFDTEEEARIFFNLPAPDIIEHSSMTLYKY